MPAEDRLFDRYRRCGDVDALGEVFDRTAPALLRVALHLTKDPAEAEDLLQSTFLKAIEAAASWNADHELLPWLTGILRHQSLQRRGRAARTPDPARIPTPPSRDPVAAAQDRELTEAMDAAIAELPERYRSVLRLGLAYGHHPAEIAHALDRPPGTVRSQLARGLELLRKTLPSGFASALALLFPGRGLAAVRAAVLQQAAPASAASALGAITGGTLLMKKTLGVLVAALVVGGVCSIWLRPDTTEPARSESPGNASTAHAGAPEPAAEPPPEGARAAEREEVRDTTAPVTTGTLRVSCRFGPDGPPAGDVLVQVDPVDWSGTITARTARTDADGQARIDGLPAVRCDVTTDRGGMIPAELAPGRTTDAELVIPPGVDIEGRVVDENGAPVPAATVWLSSRKRQGDQGRDVCGVDPAGRFFLRSVEPGRFLSAHAPLLLSATLQPVAGEPGATSRVELVLRGGGVALVGLVVDPTGDPVASAKLLVGARDPNFGENDSSGYRPPRDLSSDPDGRFRVDGLQPGAKVALWARSTESCTWFEQVQLAEQGNTDVTVHLQRGATVTGTATGADGAPIAGAFVSIRSIAWFPRRQLNFHDFRGPEWAKPVVRTDADGRYCASGNTPGTLFLLAGHENCNARDEIEAEDGQTVVWDPLITEGMVLAGEVVDTDGKPLAGWEINGTPPRGEGDFRGATTDATGRFRWTRCEDVPYRIDAYQAGVHDRVRPIATLHGVRPGEPVVIRVGDDDLHTAAIEGTLWNTDDLPPPDAEISIQSDVLGDSPIGLPVDPATGRFHAGPIPAGRYFLQGHIGDRRSAWYGPFEPSRGQTLDVGFLKMPETGSLRITVHDERGAALDGVQLAVVEAPGEGVQHNWAAGETSGGVALADHLAPGSYRLRAWRRSLATVYQPVTVTAGEETEVEVIARVGVTCRLTFGSVSGPVPMQFRLTWTYEGAPWTQYDNTFATRRNIEWNETLLPGAYSITVESETGGKRTTRFTVSAGDPADREIRIDLP